MFKVVNQNAIGEEIELYRTIFRFPGNPGDRFETVEKAEAAIEKARPFHKARFMKACRIVEA